MKTVTVTLTMDEARALYNRAINGSTLPKHSEDSASFMYRVEHGRRAMRKLSQAIMGVVREAQKE